MGDNAVWSYHRPQFPDPEACFGVGKLRLWTGWGGVNHGPATALPSSALPCLGIQAREPVLPSPKQLGDWL